MFEIQMLDENNKITKAVADCESELKAVINANREKKFKVYYSGTTTRMSAQMIKRIANAK